MRTLIIALISTLLWSISAKAICAPPVTNCKASPVSTTAGVNQMAILAPCSPDVMTSNQNTTPALVGIGISDSDALVPAGQIPVSVQAQGLANVEVWTHGSMATKLTNASGEFVGTLDLTKEVAGPLHVIFHAWDSAPGVTGTIHLQAEYTLLVNGTRVAISPPAPACGMTLAYSDNFSKLSATPCKPGTGTWPNCTAPSASDGFKWYENLANGQDFGNCANEHTDGKYNPFTILPMGGLRIRETYDTNYIDPYGAKRTQYCGVLSSGFKDGTNSLPTTITDGYYAARVMVPNSACRDWGNNTCSGGTWPSFWMTAQNSTNAIGGIELDMMEMYGNNPAYFQGYTHAYAPASYPPGTGKSYAGQPNGDLTNDFHVYGMLVTGSGTPQGKVCNYLDDAQMACSPMPHFAPPSAALKPTWNLMVELASGGGWHEAAPPSNQYDYFVDWVAVWK